MTTVRRKTYSCEQCDHAPFTRKAGLNMHLERAWVLIISWSIVGSAWSSIFSHRLPTDKMYQCAYIGCDKSFKTKKDCNVHEATHTNPNSRQFRGVINWTPEDSTWTILSSGISVAIDFDPAQLTMYARQHRVLPFLLCSCRLYDLLLVTYDLSRGVLPYK